METSYTKEIGETRRHIIQSLPYKVLTGIEIGFSNHQGKTWKGSGRVGKLQSPKIDGVVSEFYKKFWDVVGHDYWLMMSIAIKQGKFLTRVTQGLITLMPKGGEKEDLNN